MKNATERLYIAVMQHWDKRGKPPAKIFVSEPLFWKLEDESGVVLPLEIQGAPKVVAKFCGVPIERYKSDEMEFSLSEEVHKIV